MSMEQSCSANVGRGTSKITAVAFNRGGNWNNTSNAGVFSLNLNNGPANTNSNIGFRCSRYASPAYAGDQNENSTEFSQKNHRSILTHSFSQTDARECGKISGPYLRFVPVIPHSRNERSGRSGWALGTDMNT